MLTFRLYFQLFNPKNENANFLFLTESAVILEGGSGTDEFEALATEERVEWIVLGDINGQTGRVTLVGKNGAALGLFAGLVIDGVNTASNVVINHLTPRGQKDGDGVIVKTQISVNGGRNGTGSGKFLAGNRHARVRHALTTNE